MTECSELLSYYNTLKHFIQTHITITYVYEYLIYKQARDCRSVRNVFGRIGVYMATLNSSTNFILYSWFGRRFRTAMKKFLCPQKVNNEKDCWNKDIILLYLTWFTLLVIIFHRRIKRSQKSQPLKRQTGSDV